MKFAVEKDFKKQALYWAKEFKYCCYCNPNTIENYPEGPFINVLAVGSKSLTEGPQAPTLANLEDKINENAEWIFGHFTYDLKNEIEKLKSDNPSFIDYPLFDFFKAEYLILFQDEYVEIIKGPDSIHSPGFIYNSILETQIDNITSKIQPGKLGISKREYIQNAKKIIQQIEEGDLYEMNYCINYLFDDISIDPVSFYLHLVEKSPTPFSVLYKSNDKYALGSSPERFLKKQANKLISQPIKGTIKRGSTQKEDDQNKYILRHDEKELAENMMIVDLVRNDLAKSSKSGTVQVNEMFGIYSFQHWHQMISTVTSKLKDDIKPFSIIKNAFPMGSMTGAPKVKVMQLIEHYENFRRGLYSGTIGYMTPEGDFDFNVVIRTLFYDQQNKKAEFMVGSAITHDSIPEKEYDECLLKAQPIVETLNQLDSDLNLNLMN